MFKDLLKRSVTGILVGAGVVLLAPIVLPAAARAARPLAKAALHGDFDLMDWLKSLTADDEKKITPVVGHLLTAGVEEVATAGVEEAVAAASEGAVEEGVTEAIVAGVTSALEGV
ncbi:MAG: hypothetical protein WBV23_05175 [Desulfobaccales bacterium]